MLKGSLPNVFLDTDVAFDIISKRAPNFADAVKLLDLAAKDQLSLQIAESSLANLIYLSYDIYKLPEASSKLLNFMGACNIVNAGKPALMEALASQFKDKEDTLQYYTALHSGADYFITRNIKDYRLSSPSLPVFHPRDFLDQIN
ncbi:type II toxin-antitoxin system VapC family toxin [Cyclobacterium plantarum]|uniref:PIN domain-containing protein n=1 Tax=Cyclobacterium plantarum TaxID=2716263 RepID=A0ABX0HC21_9BACT|nr:PIN domain-containing protein [Cyclobacterium plantarum]NHE57889.1 PIN domain-containing protein [Cyclobacterium plantarum]